MARKVGPATRFRAWRGAWRRQTVGSRTLVPFLWVGELVVTGCDTAAVPALSMLPGGLSSGVAQLVAFGW